MQDIKQTVIELMDAAAARGLAEFELEVDDFKLKLKMGGSAAAVPASVPVVAAVPVAAAPRRSPLRRRQRPLYPHLRLPRRGFRRGAR